MQNNLPTSNNGDLEQPKSSRLGKIIPILPVHHFLRTHIVLWLNGDFEYCLISTVTTLTVFYFGISYKVMSKTPWMRTLTVYWVSEFCQLPLKRRVERRLEGMHLLLIRAMSSLPEALLIRFDLRSNVTALNISTFSCQKLQTRWKLFIL